MIKKNNKRKKWRSRDILFVDKKPQDYEFVELKEEGDSSEIENVLGWERYDYADISKEEEIRIDSLKKMSGVIDERLVRKTSFRVKKSYNIDYKAELNKEQLIAVCETERPLLVIAGAGSGKTRVIIYKVAYLIENGILPNEIVLLTFTKKAANEMLSRTRALLKDRNVDVRGGTFHSFANYALRRFGGVIGIPYNFTIIDTKDSEDVLDLQKQEIFGSSDRKGLLPKKSELLKIISRARSLGISIKEVISRDYFDRRSVAEEIETIYKEFSRYKKEHNVFDYDDLMEVFRDGLKDNEVFRANIQNSIKYILVDEYQDTNNVQRQIVELLAGGRSIITVVGDDSQSIYSFRGANYENILRFHESFPDGVSVKIEENYRSGGGVISFTNDIIANAKLGFKKALRANKGRGNLPAVKIFPDIRRESEYIARKILEIKEKEKLEFSDFAVLTRASWASSFAQTSLTINNIPFVVVGGVKFSERRHIRDIVAFLRIVINPVDASAWNRVLRLAEGVGNVRAKEVIRGIDERGGVVDMNEFQGKDFYLTLSLYEKFYRTENLQNALPEDLIKKINEFYDRMLKRSESDTDYFRRSQDIETLIQVASSYHKLEDFLSDFSLEPPSDNFESADNSDGKKNVVVSTIHSAKGLEWDVVFLPVALDGIIPSERSAGSFDAIEEERRLFYVASSRAKEHLFITMPRHIDMWGKSYSKPSRFLAEIDNKRYDLK